MKTIVVDSVEKDREVFLALKASHSLGLDTETSGLSFVSDSLWSVQLSDGETLNALYDHTKQFSYPFLAQLLGDNNIIKIAHSAAFDLKFLWQNRYQVNNIACIKVIEQALEAGRLMDFGLKDMIERYLSIKIDKSTRKDFYLKYLRKPSEANPMGTLNPNYFGYTKTWTPELIEYATKDVEYLPSIYNKQLEKAKQAGLFKTVALETMLVPVIARAEYRGILIDEEALNSFEKDMQDQANAYEKVVIETLEPAYKQAYTSMYEASMRAYNSWEEEHKQVMKDNSEKAGRRLTEASKAARNAHSAIKPRKPVEYSGLNISSPAQLKQALALSGVYVEDTKKATLEDFIETTVVREYLEYNKYNKLAEFAGIRNNIDKDGLVHASFNQNGTETGRMSCSSPNLQNQPARSEEGKRLRSCFKARDGYSLVVADYPAIELIILGVLSNDTRILEAINENKDLHLWTMQFFMDCPYDLLVRSKAGEEIDEVDKAVASFKEVLHIPELSGLQGPAYISTFRNYIKTLVYGTVYGLSGFGLARKFKCSVASADKLIALFFKSYPSVATFLKTEGVNGFQKGYSVNINGRVRYYKTVRQPYRKHFISEGDFLAANREFYKKKSRIERQASNAVIQSVCADIVKLACLKIDKKLKDQSIQEDQGIVLIVHDEIVLHIENRFITTAAELLKASMQEAAYQILGTTAKIEVEASAHPYWKK